MPKEATIVDFADDLAVVVVQPDLTEKKTEAVLITKSLKRNAISIHVVGHIPEDDD